MQPTQVLSVPGAPLEIRWSLAPGTELGDHRGRAHLQTLADQAGRAGGTWAGQGSRQRSASRPRCRCRSTSRSVRTRKGLWVNTFMDGITHYFDLTEPGASEGDLPEAHRQARSTWSRRAGTASASTSLRACCRTGTRRVRTMSSSCVPSTGMATRCTPAFEVDFTKEKLGRAASHEIHGPAQRRHARTWPRSASGEREHDAAMAACVVVGSVLLCCLAATGTALAAADAGAPGGTAHGVHAAAGRQRIACSRSSRWPMPSCSMNAVGAVHLEHAHRRQDHTADFLLYLLRGSARLPVCARDPRRSCATACSPTRRSARNVRFVGDEPAIRPRTPRARHRRLRRPRFSAGSHGSSGDFSPRRSVPELLPVLEDFGQDVSDRRPTRTGARRAPCTTCSRCFSSTPRGRGARDLHAQLSPAGSHVQRHAYALP